MQLVPQFRSDRSRVMARSVAGYMDSDYEHAAPHRPCSHVIELNREISAFIMHSLSDEIERMRRG